MVRTILMQCHRTLEFHSANVPVGYFTKVCPSILHAECQGHFVTELDLTVKLPVRERARESRQ